MAYAMKIHLKKNAAAKGLELKERFQQQELQTASTLLRAALSRPTTQGGPSTAEMGYGKFSQPGIPGGSTLIFEIELLGIG